MRSGKGIFQGMHGSGSGRERDGSRPGEWILHIDGDDFFASLARMKVPRLTGRPVVVGNLESRGYVVAASYEARSAGVHSGLTMAQAGRVCPDAALVQIDWELAERSSSVLMGILSRYSPLVERSSLDAMFMDYSGCELLFGNALDFARRLQRDIRDQARLSVSVGLSADKAVSVVACRAAKLGRLMDIVPGREAEFVCGCPVKWLPGVTAAMTASLRFLGVHSIGHLAQIPPAVMEHVWGGEGLVLSRRARCIEHAPVTARRVLDEPEVSRVFPSDVLGREELTAVLAGLSGELGGGLRMRQRSARRVVLRIVYSDRVTAEQQAVLMPPSNRDPEIFAAVRRVFDVLFVRRVRVRSLNLRARHLVHCPPELPLGDAVRRARWNTVLAAADAARRRFPQLNQAVRLAASLPSA